MSDTFGSALWTLDYMLTLASHGASGVNMETGINQLDFISPYSPIMDDQHGDYTAAPDYYGMLAFSSFSGGERLAVDYDSAGLNATVYAVKRQGNAVVAIVNKDRRPAEAHISAANQFRRTAVMRLTGPSLASKSGGKFGDSTVNAEGRWRAANAEPVRAKHGYSLRVPAASAAIMTLYGNQ